MSEEAKEADQAQDLDSKREGHEDKTSKDHESLLSAETLSNQGFEKWAESEKIALCLWAKNGTVFFQNENCRSVCGDRAGTVCGEGCQVLARISHNSEEHVPAQLFSNRMMHNGFYDVVVMPADGLQLTMLKPRRGSVDRLKEVMTTAGLTARETQVALLAIQGLSNAKISHRLNISRATVKTHLNRAYKKLGKDSYLLGRTEH